MYIMELTPLHSNRKSFYGKAKVLIQDNGAVQLLSYDTIVCEIDTQHKFNMLWDGKSNTTTRHITEFKKQFLEEMKMRETTINKIIEYFENNEDIFNDCIEKLDSYNGYLNDYRYYEMEMLNELYQGTEPTELLYRVFYGYDEDSYTTDSSGNKTHGEFNPNREYFRYNGYGNLVSTNYKDYSAYLDSYAIEAMSENRQYIDSIENDDELTTLFDELENSMEE